MSIPATATIDQVTAEFMTWWSNGNTLGKGNFLEVMEKVKKAAEGLPIQAMTLHDHWFRFGFDLYYGGREGVEKYIPIQPNDAILLKWQAKQGDKPWWPVKDPETGTHHLIKVTLNEIPPPTGSTPTDQYIDSLVYDSLRWNSKQARKVLEALKPYASLIKNNCGDSGALYRRVKSVVPDFPDV